MKFDFYKCPICFYQLSVPAGQILMPFIKKCPKCNVELKKQDWTMAAGWLPFIIYLLPWLRECSRLKAYLWPVPKCAVLPSNMQPTWGHGWRCRSWIFTGMCAACPMCLTPTTLKPWAGPRSRCGPIMARVTAMIKACFVLPGGTRMAFRCALWPHHAKKMANCTTFFVKFLAFS